MSWDRSANQCGYVATVTLQGGFATATNHISGDNIINVVTRDQTGQAADRAFFVQMVC